MMERPEFITEDMVLFIEAMDANTRTNLFTAVPRIMEMFPWLSGYQAQEVLRCSADAVVETSVLA